jgi:hypothetical protein
VTEFKMGSDPTMLLPPVEKLDSDLGVVEPILSTGEALPALPHCIARLVKRRLLRMVDEYESRAWKSSLEELIDYLNGLRLLVIERMALTESVNKDDVVSFLSGLLKKLEVIRMDTRRANRRKKQEVQVLLWWVLDELDAGLDEVPRRVELDV